MAPESVLAVDLGSKRVGLALASLSARLPSPIDALSLDADDLFDQLSQLIAKHNVVQLVVGYPRGLSGQTTDQTKITDNLIKQLEDHFKLPVARQDEAVTSVQAEKELIDRGKLFAKADIDSLAAVYILEDWLSVVAQLGHN